MIPEPGDLHKAETAHASRGGGELIVHHLWLLSEVLCI